MLLKRRGPLPVLALALALVGVSEGVAAAQTPREVALKYAVDNAALVRRDARGRRPPQRDVRVPQHAQQRDARQRAAGPRGPGGLRGQRDDQRRARQPRHLRRRHPGAAPADRRRECAARRRRRGRGRGRQARSRASGGPASAAHQGRRPWARHGAVHRRHLGRADPGRTRLLGDQARPAPRMAGDDRRRRRRAPVGDHGRRVHRRPLAQGRLELARQDAESRQRRVGLPRVRVPEAGPERRRAHVGDQPRGRVRLSVRVA